MELKNSQDFYMKGGEGETSYARNSTFQREVITLSNSIIEEAVGKCMINCKNLTSMGIADLGCASGPNTLISISNIISTVEATCSRMGVPLPELKLSLNDLPGNDFNTIFKLLPEFYDRMKREKGIEGCFVSCVGGSFYGRLFPANTLHLVHSSSSLHWLSQVPEEIGNLNRGKITISKTSPPMVAKAYLRQFQNDFYNFLRSRAVEMVAGGQMVLTLTGRRAMEATHAHDVALPWELLAQALMSLASDGLVEEEKIDGFNIPLYAASSNELKSVVQEEASFVINRVEECNICWDQGSHYQHQKLTGQQVAKIIRAVLEPMLESTFGKDIMDQLFQRFGKLMDDYFLVAASHHAFILLVSLSRSEI